MRMSKIACMVIALFLTETQLVSAIPEVPMPPAADPDAKVPPKDGKCRAVAMRGGGTKGAYEVGALKAMVDMMVPIEYAYDVVVGVSCGAINAAFLAIYKRGFEKVAIDFLLKLWGTFPITDFWSNWSTLGPLEGLFRSGLVDNKNVKEVLEKMLANQKF